MVKYTLTEDSLMVLYGGETHTIQKGAPNFLSLREALVKEDWAAVPKHLSVGKAIETWAQGEFKIEGSVVRYKGSPLPADLTKRILGMATQGKSPQPLMRFWERLQRNPSGRSVDQLWSFLNHLGIPLTVDGCFLAYKGVNANYTDCHSGTFVNKPGAKFEMERNLVSDDPRASCHEGFHVGAIEYARGFGPRVIICKVDPADVVSVPYDCSCRKMRVCRYEVVGNFGDRLDNLLYEGEVPPAEPVQVTATVVPPPPTSVPPVVPALPPAPPAPVVPPAPAPPGVVPNKQIGKTRVPPAEVTPVEPAGELPYTEETWKLLDKMGADKLLGQTITLLRRYASMHLAVIGAYKMPGGKAALLTAILKVR